MADKRSYTGLVWREAVRHWSERLADWQTRMIAFICESALLFALLYFLPILGSFQGEARLVIAGTASVIGATALLFIWDILCSPKRLHDKIVKRLKARHEIVVGMWEAEHGLRILAALHAEGKSIYDDIRPVAEYIGRFEAWDARVVAVLTEHFSVSDLFKYQNLEGAGWFLVEDETDQEWLKATERTRQIFTARLKALYQTVEFGGGNLMDVMAIRELIKDEQSDGLSPLTALWNDNQLPPDTGPKKLR